MLLAAETSFELLVELIYSKSQFYTTDGVKSQKI